MKNLIGKIVDKWKQRNAFLLEHTVEELEKQKVHYLKTIKPSSYNNPVSMVVMGNLNEGLIKTYPSDKVIKYMTKYFNFINGQITSQISENGEESLVLIDFGLDDDVYDSYYKR